MSLNLKVLSYKGQPPPVPITVDLSQAGGTIGRSEDRDLVLPDPSRYISRCHALISYEAGRYLFEDTSLSGSFFLSKKKQVHQNRIQLEDGDQIEIGDYEIGVTIYDLEETRLFSVTLPQNHTEPFQVASASFAPAQAVADRNDAEDSDTGTTKYDNFEAVVKFINQKIKAADNQPSPELVGNHALADENNAVFNEADDDDAAAQDSQLILLTEKVQLFENENDYSSDSGSDSRGGSNSTSAHHVKASPVPAIEPLKGGKANVLGDDTSEKSQLENSPEIDFEKPLSDIRAFVRDLPIILPFEKNTDTVDDARKEDMENDSAQSSDVGAEYDVEPEPYLLSKTQVMLFKSFLNAAGITDEDFYKTEDIPDLMETAGKLLRELVLGLMTLIKARAEARTQLRLEGTLLEPTNNNPIKFSADVEDALKILLDRKQKGFLSGLEAVRSSHADIRSHQLAMTVGIQAALKKALERFNPELFSQRHANSLFFLRKAKCWNTYCEEFRENVIKSIENFLDEEFVNAYEGQIAKLDESDNAH